MKNEQIDIVKAGQNDAALLSHLDAVTFRESHGSSAPQEDIDSYISAKYTEKIFEQELTEPVNNYYFLYYGGQPVGFSNIVINTAYKENGDKQSAKLDRIYLLEAFHGRKLGWNLFNFNVNLAKDVDQQGMWLYVWTGNRRAVDFYERADFKVIGSHDFRISDKHSNPNHKMYLEF